MQLDLYHKAFSEYFTSETIRSQIYDAVAIFNSARRILFLGNGGSSAISSHMMEDYMKIARKQTLSFTDSALITCFSNDYGYENAMAQWVGFSYQKGDVLVAISSSGESKNILNAVAKHKECGGVVITLSGFDPGNTLSGTGSINFLTPIRNYGIVESFHQVILHAILDELT